MRNLECGVECEKRVENSAYVKLKNFFLFSIKTILNYEFMNFLLIYTLNNKVKWGCRDKEAVKFLSIASLKFTC